MFENLTVGLGLLMVRLKAWEIGLKMNICDKNIAPHELISKS
jgi:hypothetical protein